MEICESMNGLKSIGTHNSGMYLIRFQNSGHHNVGLVSHSIGGQSGSNCVKMGMENRTFKFYCWPNRGWTPPPQQTRIPKLDPRRTNYNVPSLKLQCLLGDFLWEKKSDGEDHREEIKIVLNGILHIRYGGRKILTAINLRGSRADRCRPCPRRPSPCTSQRRRCGPPARGRWA